MAMMPRRSCKPVESRMYRRSFLSFCAAAIPAVALPAIARADSTYPDRPIQIYVPFAAGSASDVITRILLNRMTASLGQHFVVEKREEKGRIRTAIRSLDLAERVEEVARMLSGAKRSETSVRHAEQMLAEAAGV